MRRKENCVASIRYDLYAAEVTGMPDIKSVTKLFCGICK